MLFNTHIDLSRYKQDFHVETKGAPFLPVPGATVRGLGDGAVLGV